MTLGLHSVDLLIAGYQTRVRDTVRVGDVVTTEVPGLAEALRRPGDVVDIVLTDGSPLSTSVLIPDAASTLGLKAWARTVREESRDAEDLWRCFEIALADGIDRQMFSVEDSSTWPPRRNMNVRTCRLRSGAVD